MAATTDFTLQFICTFQRIGTGNRAKTTSVRMATLELKKAANLRFAGGMHFPGTDESQIKARGWHWKKTVTALVSQGAFTHFEQESCLLTKVSSGRQNGEDRGADDEIPKPPRRCEAQQEETDADLGQAEANQAQGLSGEVEMKALRDVLWRLDVLGVTSCPQMDFGDDDHHLSEHDDLRWKSAIAPS